MLESIIKRDGQTEPFTPSKLNQWGEWAAQSLGDSVDWPSAVLETVSSMSTTATSRELQQQLIRTCLNFDTWSYNRMAGRLYATLIRKDLYRNRRPTVLDLHRQLQQLGFMEMLDYSESEYAVIQEWIDHERDFEYAHYQLHTHLTKYAIADRVLGNVPGYQGPAGGFFLWLPVEDGEEAAKTLWRDAGIQVLPGAYLSREVDGFNPGQGYIRVALVAGEDETEQALNRLRQTIY